MKKRKVLGLLALASVTTLALAACGNNNATGAGAEEISSDLLPRVTANQDAALEGGTLDIASVNDSPFQGLFSPILSADAMDTRMMAPTGFGTLFNINDDGTLTDGGAADVVIDREAGTATVTIREGVTWSDGTPLTSDDLLYTYYIIANPDYTGVRFSDILNVVGTAEYRDGEADSIEGLEVIDERTLVVSFIEVSPSNLVINGGGLLSYAIPAHQLRGIPVGELAENPAIRNNPLSFGPFVVSEVVPGETVKLARNDYFWGERPNIDTIIMHNVASSGIIQALQAGQFDIVLGMPTDSFPNYRDTEGYEFLGAPEMAYTYLGFNLGTFDAENSINVMDPNAVMASRELRQAMGYALDNERIGQEFYHGLRTQANTLITPAFGELSLSRSELPGYGYGENLDRANELLDEAGFIDADGDGWRDNPDGSPLVINFASMSGGDIAEPLAQYHLQQWQEIGLNVGLLEGRLHDFQSFYDRIQADDPEIHVFLAAWSLSWNPAPRALYGPNAAFNFSRYVSDEHTALIDAIDSEAAFDLDFRREAFHAWQRYASEQAFVIPTLFRTSVVPVHTRVTNWNINPTSSANDTWSAVGVTSETR